MHVHERRRPVAGGTERVDDPARHLDPRLRPDDAFLAGEIEAHRSVEHEKAVRMPVVHVQRRGGRVAREARARGGKTFAVGEQHDAQLVAVGQQLSFPHVHGAQA